MKQSFLTSSPNPLYSYLMTLQEAIELFKKNKACKPGLEWLSKQTDIAQAITTCPEANWILWAANVVDPKTSAAKLAFFQHSYMEQEKELFDRTLKGFSRPLPEAAEALYSKEHGIIFKDAYDARVKSAVAILSAVLTSPA